MKLDVLGDILRNMEGDRFSNWEMGLKTRILNYKVTIIDSWCLVIIFCHKALASSAQPDQVNLPHFVSILNM